jgi:hypothetical protein
MAKVNRTIDEAIDEVFKDYKKAFKVAAQEASEAARDDLYANAVSCLVRYYEDYDPTSYNRTYSLMESFIPYVNPVREVGDSLLCSAGVEFDPARIANTYYGSEIYSPADPDWIIANFLAGIHPRTNGSSVVGGGNYEHEAYYGSFVPAEEMQRFIDRYDYTFDQKFKRSVGKQILRAMRK